MKKIIAVALSLSLPLLSMLINLLNVQPAKAVGPGSWSVVSDCSVNGYKVNGIHSSLTKTGKVLITAGSSYNKSLADQKIYKAWLWNPLTPNTCPKEVAMPDKDLFCSGHTHLPDGRVLFFGGTSRYGASGSSPLGGEYYGGIRESYVFDDATEKFIFTGLMNAARWYPNGPVNADGNPIVVGGIDENSQPVATNELYDASAKTWSNLPGQRLFPMYAGMTLRKNGNLCYTGTYFNTHYGVNPQCWDWLNNTSVPITGLQLPDCRDQASGVLLPPAQYQKYMVIGGGCGQSTTGYTDIVDLNAATPEFKPGPYLYPAMETCTGLLPDWSVLVAGGSNHNKTPQLQARRLAYGGSTWEKMASPTVPRMYHSSCLVLQDGTLVTMGTNSLIGDSIDARFEVYKPWYAQPGIVRPTITNAPATVQLGSTYTISYSGPTTILRASLTRLGSATHSSDPNMRLVQLGVTAAGTGKVAIKIEANSAILPPGVYMLSIHDTRVVPSKSVMVKVVKPVGSKTSQVIPMSEMSDMDMSMHEH